jgi:hypothetical protein
MSCSALLCAFVAPCSDASVSISSCIYRFDIPGIGCSSVQWRGLMAYLEGSMQLNRGDQGASNVYTSPPKANVQKKEEVNAKAKPKCHTHTSEANLLSQNTNPLPNMTPPSFRSARICSNRYPATLASSAGDFLPFCSSMSHICLMDARARSRHEVIAALSTKLAYTQSLT